MHLYFWIVRLVALFGHKKAQKLVKGQKAVWSELQSIREGDGANAQWLWFHAASVGEFEQARPIIEKLKESKNANSYKILLTFFSPSGYEMRKNYALADKVAYLPFATRRNAKRFLDLVKPEMAIFAKYEFWPAYMKELMKRNIRSYVIAAIFRKSQIFFKPWGYWYRRLLRCFEVMFVQDEASQKLLNQYGIMNVEVAGDTRFDRVVAIAKQSKDIELAQVFRDSHSLLELNPQPYKIIVAGSTWPQDEQMLSRYVSEREDVKLILVPHEIHEEHLHTIFELWQGDLVRYTRATLENVGHTRTLLLDTMGMLSSIYKYADVAYIGGGFGDGIHNTLEAAVYGIPVLFGPKFQKFREAKGLIAAGASYSVKNYAEFKQRMDEAIDCRVRMGQAAKEYVESELGATDRIIERLKLKV